MFRGAVFFPVTVYFVCVCAYVFCVFFVLCVVCLYSFLLQYFDTVGWVFWPVKNRLPYNLYCVGGDVKHCTIQSDNWSFLEISFSVWNPTTCLLLYDMYTASDALLISFFSVFYRCQPLWYVTLINEDWFQKITNRTLHMANRPVAWPMTSHDSERPRSICLGPG